MPRRDEMLTAMRGEVPSHVPYTYEALPETEEKLRAHLGARPDERLWQRFGASRFESLWAAVGRGPTMPERDARNAQSDPNIRLDRWGVRRERVTAGDAHYFEITQAPLATAETVADVEAHDWPRVEEVVWPEVPGGRDWSVWKREQDVILLDMSCIGPFGITWQMFGLEQALTNILLAPELIEAATTKVEEFTLGCLHEIFRRYPGAVDAVGCGDDYGTQGGLLVGPDPVRRLFMPSLKRHYDLAHARGVMGYHHSCGAVFDIIPALIDAGVQVLNPIQTSAVGMDPARLKREFGHTLCFHGAIDIQQTLVTGTPAEVRAEVRNRIDTLGPGGYILAPSHILQPDSPPANILAMYEEAAAYDGGKGARRDS
jgi:uroporphyrinogen decarboxylase